MKLFKALIIAQLTTLLMSCSSESNNGSSSTVKNQIAETENEEKALVNKFMGRWFSVDDPQTFIELKDNTEIVGIEESIKYSQGEFTIEEVNIQNQYIVIHIFTEDFSEENKDHHKEEYRNKLELLDNEKKLRYNFDYKNKNTQTEWIRM